MSNLQDIINLAEADGGKFFVINETGEAKLVILPVEAYEQLLLGKIQKQADEVSEINKEIIKAQLLEDSVSPKVPKRGPTVVAESPNDLRAEVIDPSFDFEGPRVEIDDL